MGILSPVTLWPPIGPCPTSDVPRKAHDVRELEACGHCGKLGFLVFARGGRYPDGMRMHVRCAICCCGIASLHTSEGWERARLCCVGKRYMRELIAMGEPPGMSEGVPRRVRSIEPPDAKSARGPAARAARPARKGSPRC